MDLPPPYSPNDPHTPTTDDSEHGIVRPVSGVASIRGGYIRVADEPDSPVGSTVSTAAAYFDERRFQFAFPITTIAVNHTITPQTTRNDLKLPGRLEEWRVRDVTEQDWSTFLNYLLTELGTDTDSQDGKGQAMTVEDFRERQRSIEAVVAEWNEGFFGPRRVRIIPSFSYTVADRPPGPSPSYRTFAENANPVDGQHQLIDPYRMMQIPPSLPPRPFMPGGCPHSLLGPPPPPGGPSMNPPPPPFGPKFAHISPHRGHHPNPHVHHTQHGPHFMRGFHGSGGGCGIYGSRGSHSWNKWADEDAELHQRGRSSTLSSSARSDTEAYRGHARRKSGRSRSSSLSSTTSSASSVGSLSSSDLSGASLADIQESLAKFRLDPARKDHIHTAVRQFYSELRALHKGSRSERKQQSKALKTELRAQKRQIKQEVKALIKGVRIHKKIERHRRKAEKCLRKAERKTRQAQRVSSGPSFARWGSPWDGAPDASRAATGLRPEQEQGVTGEVCNPPLAVGRRQEEHRMKTEAIATGREREAVELEKATEEPEPERKPSPKEKWAKLREDPNQAEYAWKPESTTGEQDSERDPWRHERSRSGARAHGFAPGPSTYRPPDSGGSSYWENFGRNMGEWGESFGRDMGMWGQRFGKDVEAQFTGLNRHST